jgi:microtubule-associated protein-like 6
MDVHAAGEVSALAFDKLHGEYALSAGGDNKLKCWDTHQKRCLVTSLMETNRKTSKTSALDVSCEGHVAIGHEDGHFTVRMNWFQLNFIVAMGRNCASAISLLKYSPDGLILTLGTEAGRVILYSAKGKYPVLSELKGHKGRITALDWSKDGAFLRSQDLFMIEKAWKAENGEMISMDKEQDWATDGRILTAGAEIGSLFRANSPTADLFIQGGFNGLLELHSSTSTPLAFKAHSYHLHSAAWSSDGQTLVTAGGEDLCLFQWKVTAQSQY